MNEQVTLFDFMLPTFKVENPIRLIELFAGYGSQAMALRNLGAAFEHYRVIEFDKYAIASYNAIHNTDFEPTDIREVKGSDLGIIDRECFTYLLTYSFPCTDISQAGEMKGMAEDSGTRSSLLWEVKRLLTETEELPQILLMENVIAVHNQENHKHFRKWLDFLDSLGYSTYVSDLNASDYCIPQLRDRTFVLSILGDWNYKFPMAAELRSCVEDFFEDMDEDQALKYVVKSEKAMSLLVELDEKNELD